MHRQQSRTLGGAFPIVGTIVVVWLSGPVHRAAATTHSHTNPHPEIQMWSYPAASANGAGSVRDRAPTFGAFSGLDENNQPVFFPGSGFDPSRRGSFLVVTDTSSDVPAGLAPQRYRIDSLRVTTTLLGSLIYEPLGYVLEYDNSLDDSVSLTTGGNDDPGQPMEMYGIGFQGDYQSVSFDAQQTDPTYFHLGDKRWKTYQPGDPEYDPGDPDAISPYQFFAIDANGDDSENAVFGGYSATADGNATAQFTPVPLSIGKLFDALGVEAAPGTLLANGNKFVFEPSLTNPGILSYHQDSLAKGFLGFSFSSLHQPAGHEGTVPYPDFYLDDLDVGPNPNGAAPLIEIQVTILDALQAGDYDGNGTVDGSDFLTWQRQLGSEVTPWGSGADGSVDGVVNDADLDVWKEHFGTSGDVPSTRPNAASVPEPSIAALLTALACAWFGACRGIAGSTSRGA